MPADIALKRLRIGNVAKAALIDGIKRYNRAVPAGIPGVPSAEGLKNVIEYEIKIPLKIDGELAQDKVYEFETHATGESRTGK